MPFLLTQWYILWFWFVKNASFLARYCPRICQWEIGIHCREAGFHLNLTGSGKIVSLCPLVILLCFGLKSQNIFRATTLNRIWAKKQKKTSPNCLVFCIHQGKSCYKKSLASCKALHYKRRFIKRRAKWNKILDLCTVAFVVNSWMMNRRKGIRLWWDLIYR